MVIALQDMQIKADFADPLTSIQVRAGADGPSVRVSHERLVNMLAAHGRQGKAFRVMRLVLQARHNPGRWVRFVDRELTTIAVIAVEEGAASA